ncbi:MAG: ChaN family lipoprotein [Alphaproteobacteria bacterium]
MIRLLVVLLLWPALASAAPLAEWRSELSRDHPLVGRIWSGAENDFVSPEALRAKLVAARFVLLGEKHDNADHHRLQAWALAELIEAGRRPAVVWEMFAADQAAALDAYLATLDATAAGLGPAVGWEDSGWPDWALYRPIAETALAVPLPLVAGNLSNADKRLVLEGGLDALPADRRDALALQAWDAGLRASLVDDLYESHCKLMERDLMDPLVAVQRLRDAMLAEAMLAGGRDDGAVLIAGAGHARRDRGVPWYLAARGAGPAVVVLFREVHDDAMDPADYVGAGAADFIWFTPRLDDRDHCAELAKRFGKHHRATPPAGHRRRPGPGR